MIDAARLYWLVFSKTASPTVVSTRSAKKVCCFGHRRDHGSGLEYLSGQSRERKRQNISAGLATLAAVDLAADSSATHLYGEGDFQVLRRSRQWFAKMLPEHHKMYFCFTYPGELLNPEISTARGFRDAMNHSCSANVCGRLRSLKSVR
jgi:hypothetical protein